MPQKLKILTFHFSSMRQYLKLRMEMGNVSKRQQPDQIKNNSRGSPTGLQCSEKFPHPELMLVNILLKRKQFVKFKKWNQGQFNWIKKYILFCLNKLIMSFHSCSSSLIMKSYLVCFHTCTCACM